MSAWAPSLLCATLIAPLALLGQQSITLVSGFRGSSDVDPFAKEGLLEATSAPASVPGITGAHATVTVGCANPVDNPLLKFLGVDASQYAITLQIRLVAADLDIVTTSSAYTPLGRTVTVKLRLDTGDTQTLSPGASDTHNVTITAPPEMLSQAKKMLLGISSGGHPVNLQVNLANEPLLMSLVQQCDSMARARQDQLAKKKADGTADEQRRSYQRAVLNQMLNGGGTSPTDNSQPPAVSSDQPQTDERLSRAAVQPGMVGKQPAKLLPGMFICPGAVLTVPSTPGSPRIKIRTPRKVRDIDLKGTGRFRLVGGDSIYSLISGTFSVSQSCSE